jgi:glycosyltransferase involved in cell wall biosynthesis
LGILIEDVLIWIKTKLSIDLNGEKYMNPMISIIVPVFNVENFIHLCIESILSQIFQDFELILVNDGSTDQSGDICEEYSKKDKRIIVIHKENRGQSSARNIGISVAKGNFIGFIDSDDWIQSDMYNILYTKAIETDADITACNIMKYNKDSTKQIYCNKTDDCFFDRNSAMNELYLNDRLTFSPCNKLYKSNLFKGVRFKEGSILEDMDFSYRIMHQAERIYYTGQALYNYRYKYLFYLKNYPSQANELYAEWFLTGLMLYINIEKYYRNERNQYRYLIDIDRKSLLPLLFKRNYIMKKKILLFIAIISPNILVMNYRFYWGKVKKDL